MLHLYFAAGLVLGVVATYRALRNEKNHETPPKKISQNQHTGQPLKMVLVARTDLKMGKGKIAAQCCHAAVQCVQFAADSAPHLLEQWDETNGSAKVVVKVESEAELLSVYASARADGLICSLIRDAGRTQIAAGSCTVCGVGPASDAQLRTVTSHLRLL